MPGSLDDTAGPLGASLARVWPGRIRNVLRSASFLSVLAVTTLLACSASSSGPLFADKDGSVGDGGAPGTGSATLIDGSAANPLATGTIVFSLDGQNYEVPGFARMHGQGNLELAFADQVNSGELRVGQGTYNGPGTYVFSSQLRRGSFDLETPLAKYNVGDRSAPAATTCSVIVDVAPAGLASPIGSEIRGSFSCSAVRRFSKVDAAATQDSDGTFDLSNGAFAFRVR